MIGPYLYTKFRDEIKHAINNVFNPLFKRMFPNGYMPSGTQKVDMVNSFRSALWVEVEKEKRNDAMKRAEAKAKKEGKESSTSLSATAVSVPKKRKKDAMLASIVTGDSLSMDLESNTREGNVSTSTSKVEDLVIDVKNCPYDWYHPYWLCFCALGIIRFVAYNYSNS
jgi:pimeloyl-CoA synthetase